MNKSKIRQIESESIRNFVNESRQFLEGKVLDFGCGNSPYLTSVPGDYVGYDPNYAGKTCLPEGPYNSILCTQVIEYIKDPKELLKLFYSLLDDNGFIIMTYPTHWEEVEHNDLWRITKIGMEHLLLENKFHIITHKERHSLQFDDFKLVIGYGVVAQKS